MAHDSYFRLGDVDADGDGDGDGDNDLGFSTPLPQLFGGDYLHYEAPLFSVDDDDCDDDDDFAVGRASAPPCLGGYSTTLTFTEALASFAPPAAPAAFAGEAEVPTADAAYAPIKHDDDDTDDGPNDLMREADDDWTAATSSFSADEGSDYSAASAPAHHARSSSARPRTVATAAIAPPARVATATTTTGTGSKKTAKASKPATTAARGRDAAYRERRNKNNEASRISRQKRKDIENHLKATNERLQMTVNALTAEVAKLRQRLAVFERHAAH